MRHGVVTGAILMLLAASAPCLSDPIDPAQAIAQKFSEADQPAPKVKPQTPPPAAAIPEPPGVDYEIDMLLRAHAEEDERRKAIEVTPETAKPLMAVAAPAPAVAPEPIPEPAPKPQPEPQAAEPPANAQPPPAKPLREAASEPAKTEQAPTTSASTRVTVLLVLDPDDSNQARTKPDPIICFDQQCWISNGLDAPAKLMPRSEAVALKTTETPTGDSCSGKSACAFRNVAFDPGSQIQVVEVGESRGVASAAYTVAADTTCRKLDSDLTCDNALVTHAFRMWVVPETTAKAAGASALEEAVADGLQDGDDDDNAADGK